MAQRRMFSKSIICTAKFLQMPSTTRLLYYDLGMQADDDGFVEAFATLRMTNASEDDLRILETKGYIKIINDGLTAYITDWKINNQIRKDRYQKSIYHVYLSGLPNGNQMATSGKPSVIPLVNQMETSGIPNGNQMATQYSIGQDNLDKNSKEQDISCAYCDEKVIISLPLNDKTMYPIFENQVKEWEELYPIVDIVQELKKMYGWLDSNPTKKKTKSGIKKFVNSWLARAQDKGGYSIPAYQSYGYQKEEEKPYEYHIYTQEELDAMGYDGL